LLLTTFLNLCLYYEEPTEEDGNNDGGYDDTLYEEPDLSGGIEGVDYGIVYGVGGDIE